MPEILQIAFNGPLACLFDYLPPADLRAQQCPIGSRVYAPFGPGHKIGLIAGHAGHTDIAQDKLRALACILDTSPLLGPDDLDFLRWVAAYYHHPLGEVMLAALPLRLRKQKQALPLEQEYCDLCMALPEALSATQRAPRQQAVVQAIAADNEHRLPLVALCDQFGHIKDVLARLQAKQVIRITRQPIQPRKMHWREAPHTLNAEQQQVIQAVQAKFGQFSAFLLDGITGSGKTEVYLQLIRLVLQQGRNVLLLAPEISLTPQLAQGLRERLGDCITITHSGLNETERELSWQYARTGLARLILGTRSLIFSPVARLGLVIVDEEHDPSFKQQDGLRYSARDLAVIRAQRANCPVLLGSATPSLESLHNAGRKRYQHVRLTQRAGNAKTPVLSILDIRDQPLQAGIAAPLLHAIQQTVARNEQALVFINRRGYAPVLSCYACGWISDCHRCDAHQTVHRAAGLLICHHCGAQQPVPSVCPTCGSPELHPLGQGTEKIENFLQARFPDIPLLRIDRDTTARKNSLDDMLRQIHQADAALLIGTQMLAKGHHFPKVTLVGVLDADTGLFSADFRATERMAQLLLQVAGRAGRGTRAGQVVIQSRYPDHPLLQTLVREGYAAFAEAALAERREAGYPPFSHQILIRAEAKQATDTEALLQAAANQLKQQAKAGVDCWGPIPAPMPRRVGKYRSHLLLQARQREPLHETMRQLRTCLQSNPLARRVHWGVDVDPYDGY